jgi:phage major head subunit gpT-like protein
MFRVVDSDSAWEEFYDVGSVPDIPEFNGKLSTLSVAAGFHKIIEPKEFGAKIDIERKLVDDKKYGVLDNFASKLMTSAQRTREKTGVKLFSNSFSTAYDFMTKNEEGVALCSSSHTTKSGTSTATGFDNAGTSALSKTTVAATRILMRGFRNDISERIEISDNLGLIVPDNLADIAEEINGTPKGYDTAALDKNTQAGRYEVIPYLRLDDTDTNNWFMVDLDAQKESAIWLDRITPEISSTVDFNTYLKEVALYMRHAYGYIDWRWVYGHAVS